MRGAARAIGWEFWLRYRLGFAALGLYLFAFAILRRWAFEPDAWIRLDPPNALAALVIVPVWLAYFFFVAVFSFGLDGDLGGRESVFPRRMFTRPITTRQLAGWPMAYGTAASVLTWLVMVILAHGSGGAGFELPLIWPALAMAAFLAWMQAFTWMAYPVRGLRVAIAVLMIACGDAVVILAILFQASDATMIAIVTPPLLLAYLAGYVAVARARRGEVPRWRLPAALVRAESEATLGGGRRFASASRAQAWLEWRRHGWSLPLLVAYVVPCELLLYFLPENDTSGMIFVILFVVVLTPPALAMLAAPALSTFSTHAATRPLTTAALVAAKLRMTIQSVLAAWLLTAVLTASVLLVVGAIPVVVEGARWLGRLVGPTRATLAVILFFGALVLATWKNLVLSLGIGLTGRPAFIKASVLAGLVLVTAAFPLAWVVIAKERVQALVFDWLPWILAALVWTKVSAGAWIAIRLHDHKVLDDRVLVVGAFCWLLAVAVVYGVLWWIADSPLFPFYLLGALAILAVPLVRLSSAPLALAWSRHR